LKLFPIEFKARGAWSSFRHWPAHQFLHLSQLSWRLPLPRAHSDLHCEYPAAFVHTTKLKSRIGQHGPARQ